MRNTFQKANQMKGVSGENLLSLLERRFDNIIYKTGFAASRKEARQLVRHSHFVINGKKADIPSMILSAGDTVELRQNSRQSAKLSGALDANSMREVPAWLDVDKNNYKAVLKDLPKREDVTSQIEEHLIVELYTK